MRKLVQLIVAIMLVSGSLVAVLATKDLRDFELRGYVDPTKDQNLPFVAERPGVNVELLQYNAAELTSTLERIRAANFAWIRQFAYWDEIEPKHGEYDWSGWDQLAETLRHQPGLEPVVVLMNSPPWAQNDRDIDYLRRTAPPRSLADFAAFCREFATRYGDLVDYYQIWDEPNLGDAWGGSDPRPADYVALLAAARKAILQADPAAIIVAAGLAPTVETSGRNISDIRYLEAMYAHGARALMDVVAGKPYGQFASPHDRRVDESLLNFSRVIALREVMLSNADGKKPLWASNYGWNSLPKDWAGDASIWGEVTEDEQVEFTRQALDRMHREWPWLGPVFLHHWQPAADSTSAQWGFALVKQDGSASALLQALQAYQYPRLAQNGLYHARNRHARYSGIWEFGELGADIGWLQTSDSHLAFDYYGADVAMLLREDEYVAFLYPAVDGQAPNAIQHDAAGNGYVFLRSNSRGPELNLVPIATNLPLGAHTLSASADQGWDRWAIAGYAVSSGDLSAPYDRQIALGAFAAALSLIVFIASAASAPWTDWLPALSNVFSGLSDTARLLLTGLTSIFMMLAMLWTWDSPRASIFVRDEVNIVLALLTGGALYISESVLITLFLAVLLFIQIYHRLSNGILLTLFWAPFFLSPVELYSFAIPMVEVILLISVAAGFIKAMVGIGSRLQLENSAYPALSRDMMRRIKAMDIALVGILLLALVSLLWTRHLGTAMTELRTLIIEPFIFYLLLRFSNPNRKTLLRLYVAVLLASLTVSLIGLYQISLEQVNLPLKSVYGSPNNVGLLLGRAIPLALSLVLFNVDSRLRKVGLGCLAIMLPSLFLTQSIGAILLGVPAGVTAVLLARFGRKAIGPMIALAALGLVALLILSQVSATVASALDFTSGTKFIRLRLWESSISMLRDWPIRGIGLDQFLYYFGGQYLRPDAIWDADLSHPHNFILDFWTRLSVFGVVLFGLIQLRFWRLAASVIRNCHQNENLILAMAVGLSGSMAALLAHGAVDNSVFVIDLAFIFMFQLAAILRLRQLAPPPDL